MGVRSRIVAHICRVAGVRRWVFLQSRQTRDQHDNCYDILEVIAQRDHMLGSTKVKRQGKSTFAADRTQRGISAGELRGGARTARPPFGRVGVALWTSDGGTGAFDT